MWWSVSCVNLGCSSPSDSARRQSWCCCDGLILTSTSFDLKWRRLCLVVCGSDEVSWEVLRSELNFFPGGRRIPAWGLQFHLLPESFQPTPPDSLSLQGISDLPRQPIQSHKPVPCSESTCVQNLLVLCLWGGTLTHADCSTETSLVKSTSDLHVAKIQWSLFSFHSPLSRIWFN